MASSLIITYVKEDKNPGTFGQHSYSNNGYYVLGAIIGEVGKKDYGDMVRKLVIDPLELTHTYTPEEAQNPAKKGMNDDQKLEIASAALGNTVSSKKGLQTGNAHNFTGPGGGILSTPKDINTFSQKFLSGEFFKEGGDIRKAFLDPRNLANQGKGDGTAYGIGFETYIDQKTSRLYKGHDGNIPGCILSFALYDPQTKTAACSIKVHEALTPLMAREIANAVYRKPSDELILQVQTRLSQSYKPQELQDNRKTITEKQIVREQTFNALDLAVANQLPKKELPKRPEQIQHEQQEKRLKPLDLATTTKKDGKLEESFVEQLKLKDLDKLDSIKEKFNRIKEEAKAKAKTKEPQDTSHTPKGRGDTSITR
jgi:hypothetical protein